MSGRSGSGDVAAGPTGSFRGRSFSSSDWVVARVIGGSPGLAPRKPDAQNPRPLALVLAPHGKGMVALGRVEGQRVGLDDAPDIRIIEDQLDQDVDRTFGEELGWD